MSSSGSYFTVTFLASGFVCILLWGGCSSNMLRPEDAKEFDESFPVIAASEYNLSARDIQVENGQGVYLTGRLFEQPGDHGTLLIAGGNGMSLSHNSHYNSFMFGHGFRTLIISYQGFDSNKGKARLSTLLGDLHAFYTKAKQMYPNDPVILFGQSIGASISVCFASSLKTATPVIAEAFFNPKSVGYSIADKFPLLLWVTYPIAYFSSLEVPDELDAKKCLETNLENQIVFLHNKHDQTAPIKESSALFEGYGGKKTFVYTGCSRPPHCHLNLYCDAKSRQQILTFVTAYFSQYE